MCHLLVKRPNDNIIQCLFHFSLKPVNLYVKRTETVLQHFTVMQENLSFMTTYGSNNRWPQDQVRNEGFCK